MSFNFSVPWNEAPANEQEEFRNKCMEIRYEALQRIAKKHDIHINELVDANVFVEPEDEWNETDSENPMSDEDWIEYVIQDFEVELKEKGYFED